MRPSPRLRLVRILALFAIFLLGCPPPEQPRPIFPDEQMGANGIALLGETGHLAPDSEGAFLVSVRDPYSGEPMADRRVSVSLQTPGGRGERVFRGETNEAGLVEVRFGVPSQPDTPEQTLLIEAAGAYGAVELAQDVYVGRVFSVLVSSDKPVYQPGQVIHIRTLALDSTAMQAAQGQPLVVTVSDPEGNKLFRQELTTSDHGVASADFGLDSQAPSGDYIITAEMGPVTATRSVEVKPYTLPRFEVTFSTDKPFYLPGETATGTVDAQYFFGKPVAGGRVQIAGSVTDVEQVELFTLEGETDENGFYTWEFPVPDYFAGQLENNAAEVDVEVTVIDTADHAETVDETVTVAEKAILIDAVPESGFLKPGLENIIYIDASTPDGRAVQSTLAITSPVLSETITAETDEFGLAAVALTPPAGDLALTITAEDAGGGSAVQTLVLGSDTPDDAVLLRPDKVEYRIGDTMNIDIYVAGTAGTAYLDIIKGKQTFGLAALPVTNGVAQASLDVDGSLLGTLELNAYVIRDNGEIVRDRRLALVNPAPAEVAVTTDRDVYRPGETARVEVQATRQGEPMAGVLGVAIVDESVFSVQSQEPGFARTYFLLERELQEPRYEIHDFVELEDDVYSPYDDKEESIRFGAAPGGPAQQIALAGMFGQELEADAQAVRSLAQAAPAQVAQAQANAAPLGMGAAYANRFWMALPLVGVALYNGTRRRRKLFITLLVVSAAAFFWSACAGPAAMPAAPAESAAAESAFADETTATQGQGEPPRLRQYFPETLYWMPEVATDGEGKAAFDVPLADSITTWRISVLASDQAGNLGSADAGLRVFQEFFVEPDLPRFLTVGDEIGIPVAVYNYLGESQKVSLTVEPGDWFEFIDTAEALPGGSRPATGSPAPGRAPVRLSVQPVEPGRYEIELAANEVAAAYVPIRVTGFGLRDFQITATGQGGADAVLKQVEVLPDGRLVRTPVNVPLEGATDVALDIPADAVPGTAQVTVKVYPGIVAQVIDGMEGLLAQPYGCFEQTSSATYPNVLILDYLKSSGQASPRVQLTAEQYIHLGYQRLLTFEVDGQPGSFSLFGDPPPDTMLTAYGLLEFTDMSQVAYVDPALLDRTANYLYSRQQSNGAWVPEQSYMHIAQDSGIVADGNLEATAYIAWALAEGGYLDDEPVQRALDWLEQQTARLVAAAPESPLPTPVMTEAEALKATTEAIAGIVDEETPTPPTGPADPYTLVLVANALAAGDRDARPVLNALLAQAQEDARGGIYWETGGQTWMAGYGMGATIETTAMAVQALLRAGVEQDTAQAALDWIVAQRDSYGAFYTTQATIQALKALLAAAEVGGEGGPASVTAAIDGERAQTIEIDDANGDVVQQVRFDDLTAGSVLTLEAAGERALQAQVIVEYYLPWDVAGQEQAEQEEMRVDVAYDRTELALNDTVNVEAEVELLAAGTAGTVLVDVGVPPGFSVRTDDLDALVEQDVIERYELTGRQIIFYLTNVSSGQVYTLPYRLQARYPLRAQTPASQAYDYYTPERRDVQPPQRITVTLGAP